MNATDPLKQSRWELLWAVQKSQRYHSRRSAFFDRWNKATAFAGLLGGTAVVASLGDKAPDWLALAGGVAVAVLSGIDLVVGTSEMARRHNDLRRRFCELESVMQRQPDADAAKLAEWKAERLSIESDEPPSYVALDILCENELIRASAHLDNTQHLHKLGPLQRATAQILRWDNA